MEALRWHVIMQTFENHSVMLESEVATAATCGVMDVESVSIVTACVTKCCVFCVAGDVSN